MARGRFALPRQASGWLVGAGLAVVCGGALMLGLQFPLLFAVPVALVVGGGGALLAVPLRPSELLKLGVAPTSTDQAMDAASERSAEIRKAVRSLTGRPFWQGSDLDETLLGLCDSVDGLARQPSLRERAQVDGDVHTLFTIATDYLPTLTNLAIENDRMHASFTSRKPRDEIAKNVEGLRAQALVLGEALERIESDVVRGVSRDAEQHAEFLRSRFAQTGLPDVLDLSLPAPTAGSDERTV